MKCQFFPLVMIFATVGFCPEGNSHSESSANQILRFGPMPEKNSIDGEAISQAFGQKGDAKDGMYKITIGRETRMVCGCTVGNTMGINTWAAFASTPDDALVVGDFVMRENELQTVLKTLREIGINIVAIHQQMTGENPRMLFLHYYGRGKALALAQAVKSAINTQPLTANN